MAGAIHVGTEAELKAAVGSAGVGVPIVVVLDNDVVLSDSLVISDKKEVTLTSNNKEFCKLIGDDLSFFYKTTIVVMSGGVLRLNGVIVTHAKGVNGTGVAVQNGGTLIMIDGEISGNNYATDGGVENSGNFTMLGGKISNNTAAGGGGVSNSGGVFTMSGGVISNNKAVVGGGVVTTTGFTMSGGEISGNTAHKGGGVYNYFYCTVTLSGNGVISNNKADIGGGLCIDCNFTMSGGEISNNIAEHQGGGVYFGMVFSNCRVVKFLVTKQ